MSSTGSSEGPAPSGARGSGVDASEVAPRGLAGLTPSGRATVPAAWALYDFANTMFSFAVVSGAIGLYLIDDRQFGERDGNALLSIAIIVSVGLNALVSPILGALSDRGGRRMPFLLFFTLLCIGTTFFIVDVPPIIGLGLFIVANFAYQASLIYYDATLKTVSYPATRGKLSGIGTGIGYMGTVFVGLLIFVLDIAVVDRFRVTAVLFLLFAIPIFWFVREPRRPDEQPLTRRDMTDALGQLRRSIADAGEVPGLVAIPRGPVLLLGCGQHRDRRDERRRRADDGSDGEGVEPHPADAHVRRDRDELRLGLARRPTGAEEDPCPGC